MPPGRFLGACAHSRQAPGFTLSELIPTVPQAEVARHTHEEAHLIVLLEGRYLSSAEGAPAVAGPPLLIYNPPGTTHRDRFQTLDGRFLTISVDPRRLAALTRYARLPERATAYEQGSPLAAGLARECRQWDAASPLAAEGLCLELVAGLALRGERAHRRPPRWLERVRAQLREQHDAPRIGAIAREAGVHPVHLARTFREFYQCTPGEYLRRCRLERAARLVAAGVRPIAEIALDAGFTDQSHFSRIFRRVYGVPPGAYRRACVANVQDGGPRRA